MDAAEVNFVSAICFIKRGVAKERPDKIALTPQELQNIIARVKEDVSSGSEDEGEGMDIADDDYREHRVPNYLPPSNGAPDDEFNFASYDDEGSEQVAGIGDVATLDANDHIPDEDDSEAEDDIIKPTDNIILMGICRDDSASIVAHIFNEEETSFYVHHDFPLPAFPLCLEWLNYDPGSERDGNMLALGSMQPVITVWDLDIEYPMEPAFKLGSRANRKKNKPQIGHKDAVLSLSWNTNFNHILASGSADKTVILWDMEEGSPHTTIKSIKSQVQTISFNPTEAQNLLVGSADSTVRLYDCRDPDTVSTNCKSWKLDSDIEQVVWDPFDCNYCAVGTNKGFVHYLDVRTERPLWTKQAHEDEITGLEFNPQLKHFMATSSTDGLFKIWKFNNTDFDSVYTSEINIGKIYCMTTSPDNPFLFALGGDSKANNQNLINVKNYQPVRAAFELTE